MSKPDFMKPRVFKGANGKWLIVIYNNREEKYDLSRINTFKEMSKEYDNGYTKYDSIKLCKGSGMKEVHFTNEIKAHGIVCDCKDVDQSINMGIKGCKCKIVDDNNKTLQEIDVDFVELKRKGL